jgi:hypothetical protein
VRDEQFFFFGGGGALPVFRSWCRGNDATNTIRTAEASVKHTELMSNEVAWKVKNRNFSGFSY